MKSLEPSSPSQGLFESLSLKKLDNEIIYYKSKRYYFYAFINFLRWLKDPTDAGGPAPKYLYRAVFSVGADRIHKMAHKMRKNPKTAVILEQKQDLGKVLADWQKLLEMEVGTLGREYNRIINSDGKTFSSGYLLGGIIYCDGHFDRLSDWSEDAKFLVVRSNNTHDITHILSGYGTDICGEILVNTFTISGSGTPSWLSKPLTTVFSISSYIILRPKLTLRLWRQICEDARYRGEVMAKQNTILDIPFENLLDKPIEEVRKALGIPQYRYPEFKTADSHFKTRGLLGSKHITKSISASNPKRIKRRKMVEAAAYLIENGFDLKETMSSSKEKIIQARKEHKSGASPDVVRNILLA